MLKSTIKIILVFNLFFMQTLTLMIPSAAQAAHVRPYCSDACEGRAAEDQLLNKYGFLTIYDKPLKPDELARRLREDGVNYLKAKGFGDVSAGRGVIPEDHILDLEEINRPLLLYKIVPDNDKDGSFYYRPYLVRPLLEDFMPERANMLMGGMWANKITIDAKTIANSGTIFAKDGAMITAETYTQSQPVVHMGAETKPLPGGNLIAHHLRLMTEKDITITGGIVSGQDIEMESKHGNIHISPTTIKKIVRFTTGWGPFESDHAVVEYSYVGTQIQGGKITFHTPEGQIIVQCAQLFATDDTSLIASDKILIQALQETHIASVKSNWRGLRHVDKVSSKTDNVPAVFTLLNGVLTLEAPKVIVQGSVLSAPKVQINGDAVLEAKKGIDQTTEWSRGHLGKFAFGASTQKAGQENVFPTAILTDELVINGSLKAEAPYILAKSMTAQGDEIVIQGTTRKLWFTATQYALGLSFPLSGALLAALEGEPPHKIFEKLIRSHPLGDKVIGLAKAKDGADIGAGMVMTATEAFRTLEVMNVAHKEGKSAWEAFFSQALRFDARFGMSKQDSQQTIGFPASLQVEDLKLEASSLLRLKGVNIQARKISLLSQDILEMDGLEELFSFHNQDLGFTIGVNQGGIKVGVDGARGQGEGLHHLLSSVEATESLTLKAPKITIRNAKVKGGRLTVEGKTLLLASDKNQEHSSHAAFAASNMGGSVSGGFKDRDGVEQITSLEGEECTLTLTAAHLEGAQINCRKLSGEVPLITWQDVEGSSQGKSLGVGLGIDPASKAIPGMMDVDWSRSEGGSLARATLACEECNLKTQSDLRGINSNPDASLSSWEESHHYRVVIPIIDPKEMARTMEDVQQWYHSLEDQPAINLKTFEARAKQWIAEEKASQKLLTHVEQEAEEETLKTQAKEHKQLHQEIHKVVASPEEKTAVLQKAEQLYRYAQIVKAKTSGKKTVQLLSLEKEGETALRARVQEVTFADTKLGSLHEGAVLLRGLKHQIDLFEKENPRFVGVSAMAAESLTQMIHGHLLTISGAGLWSLIPYEQQENLKAAASHAVSSAFEQAFQWSDQALKYLESKIGFDRHVLADRFLQSVQSTCGLTPEDVRTYGTFGKEAAMIILSLRGGGVKKSLDHAGEVAKSLDTARTTGARVANKLAKSESPVWKEFKPYKDNLKTNGLKGKEARYYEWDHLHNDIEVFNRRGDHLGSMDPSTGKIYKPSVPRRSIKDQLK